MPNLFADLPDASDAERFEDLAAFAGAGARIERIVSGGHASPEGFWYDQDHDEWVMIARGSARMEMEEPEKSVILQPGDWLFIPAKTRHRVAEVSPDAVWLAVHGGEKTG